LAAVTGETTRRAGVRQDSTAARDRGDDSGGIDLPDALVIEVGKIDVVLSVNRRPDGVVQFGVNGRAAARRPSDWSMQAADGGRSPRWFV